MHGRVKVRTTEEEKLRKEKEREAKLKLFRNVTEKIQAKRSSGALDSELLEFTGQLLTANPDIYTLWNIRREVLQAFRKVIQDASELSKCYDSELWLTECCLKVNPKSYCAWHQREWVLTTRSDQDWKNELSLCNIYLKLDERNFHVWDYRRFIVSQYKTPLEDEFRYTKEKICDNFSNYSAWHYRSKMLVQLYPDREGGRPIADTQHKEELEMVESAAFTDPDDTSAWFYQRWLLGAVKKVVKVVVCSVTPEISTVAFNSSLSRQEVSTATRVYFNDVAVEGKWKCSSGREYDFVWVYEHGESVVENLNVQVEYNSGGKGKQVVHCKRQQQLRYLGTSDFSFQNEYSEPVIEELKKQLKSCYQLLELEPNNKWTLLTTTVLMHCCDPIVNQSTALANLMQLKEIDTMRSGYYDDLASKWIIEEYLEKHYKNIDDLPSMSSLYTFKITSLYHVQYFSSCTRVDLSNQHLTSRIFPMLSALLNCKELNLEKNLLTHLKSFPNLPRLQQLIILKGNNITESAVQDFTHKNGNKISIL